MKDFIQSSIQLKFQTEKFLQRFLSGHPWVYSNELTQIDKTLKPGVWVNLLDVKGKFLAYGFFNPHSLVAFRIFDTVPFVSPEETRKVFFTRLDAAWQKRKFYFSDWIKRGIIGPSSYRLCFGESDGLPGLVIDTFEQASVPFAVIQSHSAAADQLLSWAQEWLDEQMGVGGGVIRNDVEVRKREGLELSVSLWGKEPQDVHALDGGVQFFFDPVKGQKTGYFYDHRQNRFQLASLYADVTERKSVLDIFSYVGSWGLTLLKQNPKLVLTAVDVSKSALDWVMENAQRNGISKERVKCVELDFFKEHAKLKSISSTFDVIISDPPAMSSSAKHVKESKLAHEKCFEKALSLLSSDGQIVFASCSFHLTRDDFFETIMRASKTCRKNLQTFYEGGQGADHPVLASMPESRYLKAAICSVLKNT